MDSLESEVLKCYMCTFGVFCCGFHFEMIRKHMHELIRPNTIRFKQQEYNSRNNKAQILCFFSPAQVWHFIWRVEITSDLYI